jgi:hypothetical protein
MRNSCTKNFTKDKKIISSHFEWNGFMEKLVNAYLDFARKEDIGVGTSKATGS